MTVQDLQTIYDAKGWNGVHAAIRKADIKAQLTVFEFGLHTSKKAQEDKVEWLAGAGENQFRKHLYNKAVKSRKNGYGYNKLRGQQITIL